MMNRLINISRRILNPIKVAIWCVKNPGTMRHCNFKMLSDLLILILKVSKEDKHMMTHIAFVHPEDNKEHQIVSIWAGAGIGSSPTKRISELLEENRELKFRLTQLSLTTPKEIQNH